LVAKKQKELKDIQKNDFGDVKYQKK